MTQYPEAVLARELEMCYANISIVTDYDVGVEGHPDMEPVEVKKVMEMFGANVENIKKLLSSVIPKMSKASDCECGHALRAARF